MRDLSGAQRFTCWLTQHWLTAFSIFYGFFVGLPFLAPVFMHFGWESPARAVYFLYSLVCHQLPDRSFYFFGSHFTIDLTMIHAAWQDTDNPLVLRAFIGNPVLGWKVAWSDRMVSMYGSIWLAGLAWGALRKRLKNLPVWGLVLLALPLAIDGTTHFVSDLGGLDQGFRYTNDWLAALTGNAFPVAFYGGNAWGSFNAWMRLVTGILFGLGIAWYALPVIAEMMDGIRRQIELRVEVRAALLESAKTGMIQRRR